MADPNIARYYFYALLHPDSRNIKSVCGCNVQCGTDKSHRLAWSHD